MKTSAEKKQRVLEQLFCIPYNISHLVCTIIMHVVINFFPVKFGHAQRKEAGLIASATWPFFNTRGRTIHFLVRAKNFSY